jgi:hypothetical protein
VISPKRVEKYSTNCVEVICSRTPERQGEEAYVLTLPFCYM